jgi:hypothetical protein
MMANVRRQLRRSDVATAVLCAERSETCVISRDPNRTI